MHDVVVLCGHPDHKRLFVLEKHIGGIVVETTDPYFRMQKVFHMNCFQTNPCSLLRSANRFVLLQIIFIEIVFDAIRG
jgi:hypothetical protein